MKADPRCATCNYFTSNIDKNLYCYMFKVKPAGICMQHTDVKTTISDVLRFDILRKLVK